mmetsp:Transcript_51015/g.95658  ORF Transcript_51015/g.95658 Transcript_51015/m.95658 type:complete len:201 (-) Transcript_51015:395-997(-)
MPYTSLEYVPVIMSLQTVPILWIIVADGIKLVPGDRFHLKKRYSQSNVGCEQVWVGKHDLLLTPEVARTLDLQSSCSLFAPSRGLSDLHDVQGVGLAKVFPLRKAVTFERFRYLRNHHVRATDQTWDPACPDSIGLPSHLAAECRRHPVHDLSPCILLGQITHPHEECSQLSLVLWIQAKMTHRLIHVIHHLVIVNIVPV